MNELNVAFLALVDKDILDQYSKSTKYEGVINNPVLPGTSFFD